MISFTPVSYTHLEKEDGCQDAVDSLLEDAACNTRRHEEYYSNYHRYQLMQVDKTLSLIHI